MSLLQLPDEILRQLLYYLSPLDILDNFQLLCRHTAQLVNEPLLWRYHCIYSFKYWHPRHEISAQIRRPAPDVDWKRLFILRRNQNTRISHLFEEILTTKLRRWRKFEEICALGYDARDFIWEQCNVEADAEDVLARRYFGHAILDSIHRSVGIEQWHRLLTEPWMPFGSQLEKALGAFDLFVVHDNQGDLEDISQLLDERAAEFRASLPDLDQLTTREKALALNRWLRAENLTGLRRPDRDYRNLRNCLIGQALRHPEHESIPIISSAIFCCLAYRIGLAAGCCAFPSHVHCVVFPPRGQTLDGHSDETPEGLESMYLDPFGNDEEVPEETLKAFLRRFGWQTSAEAAMAMMSHASTVSRTAGNIRETYTMYMDGQNRSSDNLTQLIGGHGPNNMAACYYASLWVSLMLSPANNLEWDDRFEKFLDRCARTFPEDVWLVEKYLMPLYDSMSPLRHRLIRHAGDEPEDAWKVIRLIRRADELPAPVFRRSDSGNSNVPFRIGDVFRHRRYHWLGVITGWTDHGSRNVEGSRVVAGNEAREESSDRDVVSRLRLDNKTYFTYIRTTTSERYVISETNIELIRDPKVVEDSPFLFAGKFFKRFDTATCTFISNIREQYPDD